MDSGLIGVIASAVGVLLVALGAFIPKILAAVGVFKDKDLKRLAEGYDRLFAEQRKEIDANRAEMAEVKAELNRTQRSERYCFRWQERAAQWMQSTQYICRKASPSLALPHFEAPEPETGGSDVHLALTDPPSSEKPTRDADGSSRGPDDAQED